MIGQRGEGCQNAQKQFTMYYKSSLVTYFVQTCSLMSIYNGYIQYEVMIHLSEPVKLIELETEQVSSMCKAFTGNSHKSWTAYLFTRYDKIF